MEELWLADPAAQLGRETGATVTVLGVDDVESQRFEALLRGESMELARAAASRSTSCSAPGGRCSW